MSRSASAALVALFALAGAATPVHASVDCFADRLVNFQSGFADPNTGFRFAELPGILLGQPGASLPQAGSTSTMSTGTAGVVTLQFTDNIIVDGPGADFIVFENAFFKSTVPSNPNDSCFVFAEPVMVEVSNDGNAWFAFPFNASALSQVAQDQTPCSALPSLLGLAGLTPTFSGNWTVPNILAVWDSSGTGGVSGAGGDAFDLADVGLGQARYVRLTDMDLGTGFAGSAEGADLDSVVAIHAVPGTPDAPDSDGDLLSDADEINLHLTDPFSSDSDGDGIPDGEEVASCRDPLTSSTAPYFVYSPDLHFGSGSLDSLRWNFLSATTTYDLMRGDLLDVLPGSDPVDLGPVNCIDENSFNLTSGDNPDGAIPAPGSGFFYLLRPTGATYGTASDGRFRAPFSGDCAP
jgi:hypothetical protein